MERDIEGKDLILSLHKLIQEKREIDRISWDNLGNLIGYSGVGVKKALKNKSLSITKLEEIIIKFDLSKEAQALGLKLSDGKHLSLNSNESLKKLNLKNNILRNEEDLALLESICISNWDLLMKRESFKNKVELTTMKNINKILDERLAIILKNIKE